MSFGALIADSVIGHGSGVAVASGSGVGVGATLPMPKVSVFHTMSPSPVAPYGIAPT